MNRLRPSPATFLTALLVALVFTLVPLGSAHVWNFENKGELCAVAPGQYAPHGHAATDGHAHWHHTSPAASAHAHWDPAAQASRTYPAGHDHPWWHTAAAASAHDHFNPATWAFDPYPAGHTHASPMHDPCLQTRMDYPAYLAIADVPLAEVGPPKEAIDPLATLFPADDAGHSRVYSGGEAYEFPIPLSAWKRQTSLVVASDLQAAGMGFPGSGTRSDPYVIQGYIIEGNLIVKNTSKCFVLKNNVVVNRVIAGPPIPDLPDVPDLLDWILNWTRATAGETLDYVNDTFDQTAGKLRGILDSRSVVALDPLVPGWQDAVADANAARAAMDARKVTEDAAQAVRDGEKAVWDADRADWDAQRADWQQRAAQWQAAWDQYAEDYFTVIQETEYLAGDFRAYASQYAPVTEPAKAHAQHVDYPNQRVSNLASIDAAFEGYQQDGGQLASDNVEGWIHSNPPPQSPPSTWTGSAQAWQYEVQNYQNYQNGIVDLIDVYWNWLQANAPDEAAYQAFLSQKAAFDASYAAFVVDHDAFLAGYNAATALYQQFLQDRLALRAATQVVLDEASAFIAKAASFDFVYDGVKGVKLFNRLDELLKWIVQLLTGILDALDPNNVAQNTGQLTLDWNGQCVHAYNNVAFDLRVNQNNDRTGYATGGIIEQNRFFTIGQIRHYDGIFRDNEVGNRAFLHQLVNPAAANAGPARAINNDGANQGWYYDNVIYGQVDLDFHGHHHSPGFFAPQSHYHGSDPLHAYMRNAAGCTATPANVNPATATGPEHDYPNDNDIHAFHMTVVSQADPATCLPHFDHGKRWTSVFFNDNLVVDPNGVGLRFEDRDHRADDEQANSENLRELKKPHYHQKWVQLEGNTIVGKLFVDVLNAAGTDLWSDNWAAVVNKAGAARTQEALAHPGAEIVNSHQYRNDAWLDIQGNTILQTQSVGVLVADAADLTLFQLKDNRGFAFPRNYQLPATLDTPAELLAWLKGVDEAATGDVWSTIGSLGGQDRGVQTFAQLAYLRNAFTVQHCNNAGRGLDRGLVATDRIYDDGRSVIQACGGSDYLGANPQVDLVYTPAPAAPLRCTEAMRDFTSGTDDFYVSEAGFDAMDGVTPATVCEELAPPMPPPDSQTTSNPTGYATTAATAVADAAAQKLGI